MQGWVKLHRKLLVSDVFQNEKLLKVFIYCLLKASHQDTETVIGLQTVPLKKGQFIFGRSKAASELNMKESTVWRYMKFLEKIGTIDIKSNNKFSFVTVENWGFYQGADGEGGQQNEQQNNNKVTTNGQQMDTYKNDKNEKNNITTTTIPEPIEFFEENLCRLSPFQMQSLIEWERDFNGKKEIINEAIRIADAKNKRYFGFVEYLLRDWKNRNLESLEEIRHYEQSRFKKPKVVSMKRASEIDWEAL